MACRSLHPTIHLVLRIPVQVHWGRPSTYSRELDYSPIEHAKRVRCFDCITYIGIWVA